MSNVFDYITWRGDLSFAQDDINCIDALVFSRLSYIPFDGIVPHCLLTAMTLKQASDIFSPDTCNGEILWSKDPDFFKAVANSKRFCDVQVSGYINSIDYDSKMQFSALVFTINRDLHFVTFRGTDSSFVGWEEDFNMFIAPTLPSQKRALKYFTEISRMLDGEFMLAGHSKGGNLALYSAMNCGGELQKRIKAVYNFDGPGFSSELLNFDGYENIKSRVHSFVPQSSVFGMMLEHDEDFSIIKSNVKSFLQHDLYSWEVVGKDFIYLDERTNSSYFIDHTLETFIEKMTDEEKANFIAAFFKILEGSHNKTFKEIQNSPLSSSALMIRSLKNLDKNNRSAIGKAIVKAFKSAKENFSDINKKSHRKI